MKILIITYSFLPDVGGTEMVAYDYASLLTEMGHDVTVLSKEYAVNQSKYKFNYIQVPNLFGSSLWLINFGFILRKLDLDSFDQIILNQCYTPIIAGRFFSKKILNKTTVLIQSLEVESIYAKSKSVFDKFYCKIMRHDHYHRKCLINCRKVVSVSEFHKNKVIEAAKLSQYASKFQVVYTGIDKNTFHHIDSDIKSKFGIQNKEVLISVSRIEQMKGYDAMFSIYKRLINQSNDYIWIIIGDGPYLEKCKETVYEYSLQDYVIILGKIKREDLQYYYSAADCFWLLSNYDECLPLVYLEAQSCGIPAIGRNKGGVKETIRNTETGFLVNNDEECLKILANKEYKNIKRKNMITFLANFDKLVAAKQLIM